MPVHKNSDGTYQWGNHGKKYQRKSDAIKQMKAAFANGYKESFTFESSQYNTVDEAEKAYDDYLTGHISNVSKALDVLLELNIDFINNNEDKLRKIVSKHDASKYGKSEYEPYRKHFYPINEDEKLETEAFDKACSHHIKVNKHHWQYWFDDDGNLDIPDKDEYLLYTVERLCDWLAMSGQREQVPDDWYNANREDVVMPDYAFKLCDEVMSKVPEDYSSKMWKVTRGKLDESVGPSVKYLKKHFKNIKFNSNFSSAEIINESINSDITGRILNDILLQFQMRAVQSPFKKTEFTILSKNDKKVGKAYFTYPYDISVYVFGNKTKLNVPNNFDENDTQYDNLIDSYRNEFSKLLNASRKTSSKSNDSKVQLGLDLDESDIPDDKQSFKDFVIKGLEPSSKYIKSYKLAKENSHGQWGVFIYCYPSLDKQTGIFYDGYSTYISYDENNNYDFIFEITNDEITSRYDNDRTRVFYESYNIMNEQVDSGGYIFDNKIPRYDITPPAGYRFMYHNTSPDNLDSIDKNGLIVGNRYADNSESGIWCDDNNPSSVGYGGCTITFLVTEDEANKAKVNNTQYLFYKDIPRKDIVFIDRVLYSPLKCKVSNLNEFIEQYGESKTVSVLSKWVPKVELDSIIKLLKSEHLIENFKVLRSKKGYLVEANMNQLKRKTLAEDPTRAKKSKHVQSKYIGISKYGVLNFMTSSESHSGVQWYQEVQFPSFQGFMNIVESGDTVDAVDVKKAMMSDNIKISCFTEDVIVKTLDGDKKIKDIKVGDKVLTHTGKYQEVLQTFENDYAGDMIEINGIKSTPNHPYLVLLPDGTVDWKMACEITEGMQLLEPKETE
jgi:hypothetical protein